MKISLPRLLLFVGILGFLALIGYGVGFGSMGRFSPYSLKFERRHYSPFSLGFGAWREDSNEVIEYLRETGYVSAVSESPTRWDPVYHFNTQWRDGMGRPYDLLSRNRKRMIEWSEKHPDLAGIVWKEGFRLVRSEDSASVSVRYYLLGNACLRRISKGPAIVSSERGRRSRTSSF